jgi:hypothetical protein
VQAALSNTVLCIALQLLSHTNSVPQVKLDDVFGTEPGHYFQGEVYYTKKKDIVVYLPEQWDPKCDTTTSNTTTNNNTTTN